TENFNRLVINKNYGAFRLLFANVTCNVYDFGNGAVDLLFGNFTANDLGQDGIYGNFYVNAFCRVDLYQDISGWIDLNGTLNIWGGEFHVHGGSGTSLWGYASPAALNMTEGLVYFHDQGIEIPNTNVTLNITGGTIQTDGGFALNLENVSATGWNLHLSGTNDVSLWVADTSWLYNLTVDKANNRNSGIPMRNHDGSLIPITRANAVYANTNLQISNNINLMSGSFYAPELIVIQGNWTGSTSHTYYNNSGTVNFIGSNPSYISVEYHFYNLTVNKACDGLGVIQQEYVSGYITNDFSIIEGAFGTTGYNFMDVDGNIVISDGAGLNLGGSVNELRIAGNFTNYNLSNTPITGLYPGTSEISFNGEADQSFTAINNIQLYNLRIDIANEASFRPNMPVFMHNLNIESGGFYGNYEENEGINHTIQGNLDIHVNGSWYDHTQLLLFTGNEEQTIRVDANPDNAWFGIISIMKNADRTETRSQDVYLLTDLNLRNQGDIMVAYATLHLNGHALNTTGNIQINNYGTIEAIGGSTIAIGDTLEVLGNASLILDGNESEPVTVTHYGTGYSGFEVNYYGSISAEWTIFEYLNAQGVHVKPGAFVNSSHAFNNCTFQSGAEGGTLLRLDDANAYTIDGANFPSNTWNGSSNISKTVNEGEVFLTNVSGDFGVPAYENDTYNRIQWSDFRADLEITRFTWSNPDPYTGEVISCSATIRNSGTFASTLCWADLFFDRTTPPEYGLTADMSTQIDAIAAGDTLVITFSGISLSYPANWWTWLYLDATNSVSELEETNNIGGYYALSWQDLPIISNLHIVYMVASNRFTLSWDYSAEVDRFNIYRDVAPNGSFSELIGSTTEHSIILTNDGDRFFYLIKAEND
ncbi:MAG: CARDB domain-containing protein, partial [Candidatus Cloacimonetes bacterium]|nr:CARDB domain-containing protein [Candidatus Cloacimonadota bacterium]